MSLFAAPVHLARLARVGFVLAREGALGLVDPAPLPPPARGALKLVRLLERRRPDGAAPKLSGALTRLGPNYVKLGQFLATRPDVVGVAVAAELSALQDRLPPFPRAEAIALVQADFERPWTELFSEIGEPVAAASIAQVHRARTRDGRAVALKVLRPGVRGRFLSDLGTMRFAARLAEALLPASRRLRPTDVVDTLARSVAIEMDLRLEAAALSEMGENVADDAEFRVPSVDWARTSRHCLTMDWVEGLALNDLKGIDAAGHNREALARAVIQGFLRHALEHGLFHADMHPGNLFVDGQGQLVAVDFGIMGRIGRKERRFLAEILYGFIRRDYRRVAEVHFEAGYVPGHHRVEDFAQAIRAIGEPIHQKRADEISMARLLALLFEITALFDMATRTELVMLQKTMVTVEGVGRMLDPKLDMWSTAEPVVRAWVERNLGPVGIVEDLGSTLRDLAAAAARTPTLVGRVEDLVDRLDREGERADKETGYRSVAEVQARSQRWLAAALWTVAALLAIVAWKL